MYESQFISSILRLKDGELPFLIFIIILGFKRSLVIQSVSLYCDLRLGLILAEDPVLDLKIKCNANEVG